MRALALALVVAAAAATAATEARADSPLTSTDLHAGYEDVAAIAHAVSENRSPNTGGIVGDDDDVAFLVGDAPSDQKLALVNALGWGQHGTAGKFLRRIAVRAHVPLGDLAKKDLRGVDKAVLGYLLAMDDYFTLKSIGVGNDLQQASPSSLLAEAQDAAPTDFAVAYVGALIAAQRRMEGDWCQIYKSVERVVARFPEDKRNLRAPALAKSEEYISLYRDSCPDLKPPPEHAAELDQIYAVARLGDVVIAGTQGGVVALDAHSNKRVAVAVDFICANIVVFENAAFIGCRNHAYRFDGARFARIWTSERSDSEGLIPLVRPDHSLVVLEGKKAQRWTGDKLVVAGAADAAGAYQRIYDKDGALWSIDFLHAVHVGERVFPVHSAAYPGRDPREVVVDGKGRVFVLDFDDGIFRTTPSPDGPAFVKVAPLADKGSGIAIDDARGRSWLLHYTSGLVLGDANGARNIPLPSAEYMRALLLDDDGTVWVGGWHGLIRVDASTLAITSVSLSR
ncbi:MAG TPA: hypothetical protein VGO62_14715 [Myxococcota bacterium]|jgi:hypothetical protein